MAIAHMTKFENKYDLVLVWQVSFKTQEKQTLTWYWWQSDS